VPDLHQAIRILERKRLQQHGMHDAENGSIGTDAQGHDEYCNRSESWTLEQMSCGEFQVLKEK